MSGFEYPDLPKRLDALKEAIEWASEVKVVWMDQDDGGRVKEPNKAWIELRPRRFRETAPPGIRHEDLETAETEGTLTNPRQEVTISYKEIDFEARARSRRQDHPLTGWYAAVRLQSRITKSYALGKWYKPNNLAISNIGEVFNMPRELMYDDRKENLAIFEFSVETILCDKDEADLGTWIDRCEVTSDFKIDENTSLDSSLQLDDEVMGWADATHVVDENGDFVIDEFGNYVITG